MNNNEDVEREHRVIHLLDEDPFIDKTIYQEEKRLIDRYNIVLILFAIRVIQIAARLKIAGFVAAKLTKLIDILIWCLKNSGRSRGLK